MKALIIYDSAYGNTQKLAEAIQSVLPSDQTSLLKADKFDPQQLSGVELLVIGTPTYGGRPTPQVQACLKQIPSGQKGLKALVFDTGMPKEMQKAFLKLVIGFFGYASPKLALALEAKGVEVIGQETFFVLGKEGPLQDGEIDRVKDWVRNNLSIKQESGK